MSWEAASCGVQKLPPANAAGQQHKQQQQPTHRMRAAIAASLPAAAETRARTAVARPTMACPGAAAGACRLLKRHAAWHPQLLHHAWQPGRRMAAAAAAAAATAAAAAAPAQQLPAIGPNSSASSSSSSQQRSKQTLDYTTLAACCHELAATWVPSKVEEVVQPDRFTLALRLRTPLAQGWLHLSWHPVAARVCMGQPPVRGDVSEAFSFAAQASGQLKGLVLLSAQLPAAWERVVMLELGKRPGEPPSRRVYCEVMGKYSNVVLTAGDGAILHCAYQVGSAMSSLRQLQQGRPYQLPPAVHGLAPSHDEPLTSWQDNITRAAALAVQELAAKGATEQQQQQRAPGTLLAGASRAYKGVSPQLVQDLCAQAGLRHTASPAALSQQQWQALHAAWTGWLARLESSDYAASSCNSSGRFSVLGLHPQPHESVHDMLDGYYGSLQAGELFAALHGRLSAAVRSALKKARVRVVSFERQLQGAAGADAVQRTADIIVANIYRIAAGATQLDAEDWESGEPVSIQLDADASPSEQAEGLYRRARKLRRAVDAVAPLLEAAQQEVEYLETVELELAQMPPGGSEQELAVLRQVQEELVESRVIKPPPEAALASKAASKGRKAQKKAQKAAGGGGLSASLAAAAAAAGGGAGPRMYESPGGFVVLVGRNNKQNDVLSHQVAKPGDVWMHVRGPPGSHTVIRLPPGRQPEQADLQFAADLAAWFSKAREAGRVDVIVARAEHLKKFKGARPGQVLVTQEEGNIVARPGDSAAAAQAAAAAGAA